MGSGCKISWEKGGEGGPETERDRERGVRRDMQRQGERGQGETRRDRERGKGTERQR